MALTLIVYVAFETALRNRITVRSAALRVLHSYDPSAEQPHTPFLECPTSSLTGKKK